MATTHNRPSWARLYVPLTPVGFVVVACAITFGSLAFFTSYVAQPIDVGSLPLPVDEPAVAVDIAVFPATLRLSVRGGGAPTKLKQLLERRAREGDVGYVLREESARLVWMGAFVFQLALFLALNVGSWRLIRRYSSRRSLPAFKKRRREALRRRCFAIPVIAGVLFGLTFHYLGSDHARTLKPAHQQLWKLMQASVDAELVTAVASVFNGYAVTIGLWIVYALRLMLLSEERVWHDDADNHFRMLLFGTAALLVSVVLQIYCEFSWVSAAFRDEKMSAQIKALAASASFAYGAMFSVISAFVFIPVAYYRQRNTALEAIGQVIAVMSPLLAALPLSRIFG